MAAEASVGPAAWLEVFEGAFARVAGCFGRREPRLAARDYLLAGLTVTVETLTRQLVRRSWNRLSAGKGAKGERLYDWAWGRDHPPADAQGGQHWLLVRRRIVDGELAYYWCWSPRPVPLHALVRVAGIRWSTKECFQAPASGGRSGAQSPSVRSSALRTINSTLMPLTARPLSFATREQEGAGRLPSRPPSLAGYTPVVSGRAKLSVWLARIDELLVLPFPDPPAAPVHHVDLRVSQPFWDGATRDIEVEEAWVSFETDHARLTEAVTARYGQPKPKNLEPYLISDWYGEPGEALFRHLTLWRLAVGLWRVGSR